MTRKRRTGKALTERRRRAMRLHPAGFTEEEIADKLGVDRSVVCRDLQSARDARRSGDSPDLEKARFSQRLSGNGDRHPTRCMRLRPGTLHPGVSPLSGQPLSPGEAAASWDERKVYHQLVDGYGPQLNSICNLTQINAVSRKCPQFHEDSRSPLQIPASYSRKRRLLLERLKAKRRGIRPADALGRQRTLDPDPPPDSQNQ